MLAVIDENAKVIETDFTEQLAPAYRTAPRRLLTRELAE